MNTTKDPHLNALPGDGRGDVDLQDAFLAQALAQAPDRSELPEWHVRKAVLDHAHDAVAAAEALVAASRSRTAWWRIGTWFRRGRDDEGRRGGMPWAAAVATVFVGVMVTLLWQGEPVPDARLDHAPLPRIAMPKGKALPSEQHTGGVAEKAEQESIDQAPAGQNSADQGTAEQKAPPQRSVEQGAAEQRAVEKMVVEQRAAEQRGRSAAAPTFSSPAAPAAVPQTAPASSAPSSNLTLPSPSPSPSAPAASKDGAEVQPLTPSQMQDLAKAQSRVPAQPGQMAERSDAAASAPLPSSPPASALPAASAPLASSPLPPVAVPAAPPATTEPPARPVPNYASLSRWSELHVANVSGQIRTVPRVEGSDLVAILNEAAAQESSGEVLRELPQWRVSLEHKGQPLALLEVGRSQLRWTEGAAAPITSRPPSALLEALHSALREAVRAPTGRARK